MTTFLNSTINLGNLWFLVINTSGWVKGIGYDLLVEMLRYTSPTHVVQIRGPAERKNLPSGMFWLDGNAEGSAKLIEIRAAQNQSSSQSARVSIRKDACILRELRLIAYFRQCLPRDFNISSHKELVHSLASTTPYTITLSKVKVMHLHCQVSNTETYEGLKSAIIGLAISSSRPVSPEHNTPWCVGLGMVRAMDVSKDQLYVVTPIPLRIVEKVDIILQGLIEIPTCLLEEQDAPRSLGTSH
ncbi:polynucleotide 5'-hydroxyl-kinase NOL9-like [Iris pallida]|uniref:Polynucleotide 5'-hydroxyl-kinase NOL9-like n=1 Tax=Iris pallida TaxID=29817 RepID=A0AAX6ED88_IRIPA|nr:polynucleotide 5'-hydroxyl-kinase NOL9-like [Iris pallida]